MKERYTAYQNVLDTVDMSFRTIGLQKEGIRIKKAMLETCEYEGVGLLRTQNEDVIISNLNIDFLRLRYDSRRKLYSDVTKCVRSLKPFFDVNQLIVHSSLSHEESIKFQEIKAEINDQILKGALDVLRNHTTDPNLVEGSFNKIKTKIWTLSGQPIDVHKIEKIVADVIKNGQKVKELKKVLLQVDVFSRINQPGVWEYLAMHFNQNKVYSSDYIHEKLNEIARALGDKSPFKENTSVTESVRAFNKIYCAVRKMNPETNVMGHLVHGTWQNEFCTTTD